jgi:hypothetical protein
MRKSPNETPAQFNQRCMLVLDFVLKATDLIHLLTKQVYEKINLVVCQTYEECVSMKSLRFNMYGKGSVQFHENICHPKLNHFKINQLQPAGHWLFECYGSMFKVDSALKLPGYCCICAQASANVVQTCVENMVHETFFRQMNYTIATFLDR